MPSGAKKRKAARKKKEQEAHLKESTENPRGTDEVKSQDEKDSDSGSSNSPVHQENHDHQHQFSEGTEPEERDPAAITSLAAEKNFTGGILNGGYEEEMVLKVEESYENKDANIQNVERVKESNNGNNANYSLKQVDESRMSDKNLKEGTSNSVSEALQYDNSVTTETSTLLPVQNTTESVAISSIVSSVEPVVPTSELSLEVTEKPVIKPIEDNIYGNFKATTSEVRQKPKGYDSDELLSSHVPVTGMSSSDEHGKESGTSECSENLPLLPSAPQVVHRTSWLSCCGLFEVLSASDK